jgi:hypothetical protein
MGSSGCPDTPQASLDATDSSVAPLVTGLLTLGFDAGRFPPTPPACYRASWQLPGPDSHRQATTSLTTTDHLSTMTSCLLVARKIEVNSRMNGGCRSTTPGDETCLSTFAQVTAIFGNHRGNTASLAR